MQWNTLKTKQKVQCEYTQIKKNLQWIYIQIKNMKWKYTGKKRAMKRHWKKTEKNAIKIHCKKKKSRNENTLK